MAEKRKKRILLIGDNVAMIDDMFNMLNVFYTIISSSIRFEDLENHIVIFEPDMLLLCTGGDDKIMQKVITLKRRLTRENIVFGIFGSQENCHEFQRMSGAMADIVLVRPTTADKVRDLIDDHLEEAEALKRSDGITIQSIIQELSADKAKEEATTRKRVLVIDDDPMMLKIVKDHLHDNYDVATAVSGKIAYKFLEKKKADIILLDYEMPEENGPAVLKKLRANTELASIPIIFLTGVADRDKIREVLSLKPQGYLLKPIDKEKLLGTLDKLI